MNRNNDGNKSAWGKGAVISIIAIAIIIIARLVDTYYAVDNAVCDFFTSLGETIGITLFSAGAVSVIMEISTIEGVVNKAFNKVLKMDFPLDDYSPENLSNFKNSISLKQINNILKNRIEKEQLYSSIYKYENQLLELCQTEYYKYHSTKYFITPDEKNGLFHIKCKTSYEIINKQENEVPFRFKMKLYFTV